MMDMTIGDCQLSKLYAYNGLMLSSGIRIDGIGIDRPTGWWSLTIRYERPHPQR